MTYLVANPATGDVAGAYEDEAAARAQIAALKAASDKANPAGELRARKLIRWYNLGAGGQIAWGSPGDFAACVRIAAKHMTPAQAKGFCSERHVDATGARPGKAPAERLAALAKKSAVPAVVGAGDEAWSVEPFSLEVVVGSTAGLLVTTGDACVLVGGDADVPAGVAKAATGAAWSSESVTVDPTLDGGALVRVGGRTVAWAPECAAVPSWAEKASLAFISLADAGAEVPPGFAGSVGDAGLAGVQYVWRKAAKAVKSLMGEPTVDETRELLRLALIARLGRPGGGAPWIRDFSDSWVAFEMSSDYPAPGLYAAPYSIDAAGVVTLGGPSAVEAHMDYDLATAKHLVDPAAGPPMPTSAMVALYPDPDTAKALALDGGEPWAELHVTLAFLGSDAVTTLDRSRVEAALAPIVATASPLEGVISGLGRFTPDVPPGTGEEEWPLVALVDIPALPEFRQRLVAALDAAGVPVARNHGFTPHCTLAMVTPDEEQAAAAVLAAGVDPLPLRFDAVTLAWGADRMALRLGGSPPDDAAPVMRAGPVLKMVEAQRYTFGPLYPASPEIPSARHLDAHGEFATAADVQKAVWGYARTDPTIRRQHAAKTAIGERVELVCWPQEYTATLTKADGTTTTRTFPAGTAYQGVIWTEEAWPDVKAGRITGYSLGGMAGRVEVECGDD
jgi:2'-5' RNA ligase